VASRDGTEIAVWTSGQGPPLVLVHGAVADHTRWRPLLPHLEPRVTVHAMDRRGRGASGDAPGYAIEREFEDVAAVGLWGHSYGAGCAMGGAALTGDVHRLVLYEPGLGIPYPAGSIEEVEAALAAGDMETAVRLVLVGIVGVTEAEMAALRSGPRWPTLLASVPTVPRECRAEDGWRYRPGAFDGIVAPTLLLVGSESPPVLRQATDRAVAAIPGAGARLLQGRAHLAIRTDPAMVAAAIRQFVLG
jgi:pimeloyl-ACP methyl ester carboxylesterase